VTVMVSESNEYDVRESRIKCHKVMVKVLESSSHGVRE
jgi:hypothetical protein